MAASLECRRPAAWGADLRSRIALKIQWSLAPAQNEQPVVNLPVVDPQSGHERDPHNRGLTRILEKNSAPAPFKPHIATAGHQDNGNYPSPLHLGSWHER